MDNTSALLDQMAHVKGDALKRIRTAVTALLALAWEYRSEEFDWAEYPELEREANAILREMSDGVTEDLEKRAAKVLEEMDLLQWEEGAISYAEREIDGHDMLWRLDMQASHLKELIAMWVGVAAFCALERGTTTTQVMTYIGAPALSSYWRKAGKPILKWGRGYMRDVSAGVTLIGQGAINSAYQFAWVHHLESIGAVGYRTVRGSNYDCPICEEMKERVWPIDVIVLPYHPRCVCQAVPVYENEML